MEGTPLINGMRHSWASIRMNILGLSITGISAINYSSSTAIEDHFGAGQRVVDRGEGNFQAMASITLKKYEIERIYAALPPGAQLSDIPPFDIPVVFQAKGSDPQRKNILKSVQFTGDSRNYSQGQTGLDVEVSLIVADIDYTA
jgi:hypothetical protein